MTDDVGRWYERPMTDGHIPGDTVTLSHRGYHRDGAGVMREVMVVTTYRVSGFVHPEQPMPTVEVCPEPLPGLVPALDFVGAIYTRIG